MTQAKIGVDCHEGIEWPEWSDPLACRFHRGCKRSRVVSSNGSAGYIGIIGVEIYGPGKGFRKCGCRAVHDQTPFGCT